MTYRVHTDFPAIYLREPDTVKLLDVIQSWVEIQHDDISKILSSIDIDRAEEKYLDLMLLETGWDLKIPLDTHLKRKVIKLADYIYLNKGFIPKIVEVVKLLTGVTIEIESVSSGSAFQFDVTAVDSGFYLWSDGVGGDDSGMFEFQVITPPVDDTTLDIIDKVIDFMKWAPTTYTIKQ